MFCAKEKCAENKLLVPQIRTHQLLKRQSGTSKDHKTMHKLTLTLTKNPLMSAKQGIGVGRGQKKETPLQGK